MDEHLVANWKQAIHQLCQQKYGHVSVTFDQLVLENEQRAAVCFTVSDQHGFITRHYGHADYENGHLRLETMAI